MVSSYRVGSTFSPGALPELGRAVILIAIAKETVRSVECQIYLGFDFKNLTSTFHHFNKLLQDYLHKLEYKNNDQRKT